MLKIKNLYKEQEGNILNDISFEVGKGTSASIECSDEISDIIVELILGKQMPAKGEIYIEGKTNIDYMKKDLKNVGVVFREEGFYERITVEQYIKSYSDIIDSKVNYKDVMRNLALLDIGNVKVSKLTYSQKRRLSFARESLKEPKLLIFQNPILNMDREGAKIILEQMERLKTRGTCIVNTSVSFKDTIVLSGQAYIIDEDGLKEFQKDKEDSIKVNNSIEEEQFIYKIEKIPAKLDGRILLFDPMEIDYIESEQGISKLCIRGESFPCGISLIDLEERLRHFGFFRCHRSYLVNLQRVREVITWTRNSYGLNLDDKIKSSIPLSKGRMEELKNILNL